MQDDNPRFVVDTHALWWCLRSSERQGDSRLSSCRDGYGAYFIRAYDLMEDLRKARAEHRLDRRMRVYLAPKVLIVDEFGDLMK